MRLYFLLLVAFSSVYFSCNEEITVGSAILEDTTIGVDFTDSLEIEAKTVLDDSVVVFRTNFDSRTYLLGEIDDPSFGFSKANLYLSAANVNVTPPRFDTLTIDSVIMILPLDTLGQFGDEDAIHNIKVYQLEEELTTGDDNDIISTDEFLYNSNAIAEVSRSVNHQDSAFIALASTRDSFITSFPQLRIPMDISYWEQFTNDTLIIGVTDTFRQLVPGFLLTSEPSNSSMLGLNVSNSSPLSIAIYYTNDDGTVNNAFTIDLGAVRANNFRHDISSTPVEAALDLPATEFAYLQSMAGVNLEVDLKSVLDLKDKIINKATLSMFLLEEASPVVSPIDALDVQYVTDAGITSQILDAVLRQEIPFLDGGLESVVIGGLTYSKYDLNITNHVISIARGNIDNTKVVIEAVRKPQRASRSILLGTEHPTLPLSLKLVTSNP
ncbi:MAG: DUF4270 family protein [Saprospiraceae bacterium]|nr:DUF4270 domain-containing protein [Bacteroidia bacterium]NNE13366.1 DUF4270 family protein [Saprospiraceae bacterium]NNL90867.1 DUF4270 family protein [Saprospiraceae bacterium]